MKRALAACIAIPLGAQLLGWMLTGTSVDDWYVGLSKPSWTPPGWVFGPVWTALFLMMGVALWRVWLRRDRHPVDLPVGLFAAQLALNVAWSGLFFALRSPLAALFEIVVLWCAIAATLVAFRRVSAGAGWLLVPYLAWVGFAAALNLAIVRMNP